MPSPIRGGGFYPDFAHNSYCQVQRGEVFILFGLTGTVFCAAKASMLHLLLLCVYVRTRG
jgi:hypothetical protein